VFIIIIIIHIIIIIYHSPPLQSQDQLQRHFHIPCFGFRPWDLGLKVSELGFRLLTLTRLINLIGWCLIALTTD
jgi:hypothetical protein